MVKGGENLLWQAPEHSHHRLKERANTRATCYNTQRTPSLLSFLD
jgi:hypothetical protein